MPPSVNGVGFPHPKSAKKPKSVNYNVQRCDTAFSASEHTVHTANAEGFDVSAALHLLAMT